jgi:uncharacterized protein (DUF1501 family)
MRRREFLRLGLAGLGSMTLSQLYRLRAAAPSGRGNERPALIVVWLQGGASHLETYDPKPLAPSEIRGPYTAIATRTAGMRISELLPFHAQVSDKFSLLRSMVHTGFCHQQGNQQLFTGYPEIVLKLKPDNPDLFAVAQYLRRGSLTGLPGYVGVNPIPYLGPAYLGPTYEPFAVYGDPNSPTFEVPDIALKDPSERGRLDGRMTLRRRLDGFCRALDARQHSSSHDQFQERAWSLLTGASARRAFDIALEDPKTRDRYGRNTWGQRCLLARRLVEAGVELVTTSLDGPLCGRVGNWDDHAVNHHVFNAMKSRCLYFDRAVSALIQDLYERGLDKRVMVVVTGEFGRTPRISYANDSGSGVKQPGRDHWPGATSILFSGGGIPTGQVIGSTDKLGEHVSDRRVGVRDFLATLYRHLGIDAEHATIKDPTGRPIAVLAEGSPIKELVGRG